MAVLDIFKTTYGPIRIGLIVTMTLSAVLTIGILSLIYTGSEVQKGDAPIINVAGRQRMLTQKMSKESLAIFNAASQEEQQAYFTKLAATQAMFSASYDALVERRHLSQPTLH